MERLQDNFSTIEKEILFQKSGICAKKIITLQQQLLLMRLLEEYDNKIDKTTILSTWKQCNQIYADTNIKLKEISSTSNINKLKNVEMIKKTICECLMEENNELKIMREMCLYTLWSIISHPKIIKYRQINTSSLYQRLKQKCYQFNINVDSLFEKMQSFLKDYGFQKENDDNWYYLVIQFDSQLLLLWGYYKKWIKQQSMYYLFISEFFFYL
ncbi:hypothetical protein RFI_03845 [Reticulomyxa filosa]|uniref:Uncharacterized protein n=1 Tax=Reticulomyxa filosa TaxID=46433 RepID=X6P597_RETFI|nr:hypothetical protein RFI_03845 [Reticulomyxa filosa]|eukprot:ETO33264.1 hypothetical protein RFI_03845 [Reticulomyxa filosa]